MSSHLGNSWDEKLECEFSQDYFKDIRKFLAEEYHYDGELTLLDEFNYIPQIDLDRHFKEISQLKDEFKDKIQVGVGIECDNIRKLVISETFVVVNRLAYDVAYMTYAVKFIP